MKETMKSKLERLLRDGNVEQVDIDYKCKTRDGMIYTIQADTFQWEPPGREKSPFADTIHSSVIGELCKLTEDAEKDGYFFSSEEMVSIRKSEIIRIWAELGDLYMAEGVMPTV